MSADASILLRLAGDDLLRPLSALLRELHEGGRIDTLPLDEDVWSRPDVVNGRELVWVSFCLSSGRTVSTYVVAQHDRTRFKVPAARFCFVRDDTMDMFARCWNGESYPVERVLPAIGEWEADSRELFTLLCTSGPQFTVEHAVMSMDPDWVGPEACSMVYHADAGEVMADVLRCHLSMAHSVPMSEMFDISRRDRPFDLRSFSGPRRSDEYLAIVGLGSASAARHFLESTSMDSLRRTLDLGDRDVAALLELAAAEHARHVRDVRQELLRRSPPLEGIGMTRTVARAASMEWRWVGHGLALMTNPLSTLLHPYQLIHESFASVWTPSVDGG